MCVATFSDDSVKKAIALNDLGVRLMWDDRMDDAIASFKEALRLKPDFRAAHRNLSSAYTNIGDLENAERELRLSDWSPEESKNTDWRDVPRGHSNRLPYMGVQVP